MLSNLVSLGRIDHSGMHSKLITTITTTIIWPFWLLFSTRTYCHEISCYICLIASLATKRA